VCARGKVLIIPDGLSAPMQCELLVVASDMLITFETGLSLFA